MKREDLWDITNKEQTQLKLDILEKYLKQWALIIGETFSSGYYIDCFAGRGKYHKDGIKNSVLGSPLIAQKIGLEVQAKKQKKGKSFKFKIIGVESDKDNFFTERVLSRGFKVILNFDVPYPDRSATFYNLIFATNNPTGKKIMSHILTKKLFEGTLFEKMPFEIDHEL